MQQLERTHEAAVAAWKRRCRGAEAALSGEREVMAECVQWSRPLVDSVCVCEPEDASVGIRSGLEG